MFLFPFNADSLLLYCFCSTNLSTNEGRSYISAIAPGAVSEGEKVLQDTFFKKGCSIPLYPPLAGYLLLMKKVPLSTPSFFLYWPVSSRLIRSSFRICIRHRSMCLLVECLPPIHRLDGCLFPRKRRFTGNPALSHSSSGWMPLSHLSAEFKTLLPRLAEKEKTKMEKKEKTSRLGEIVDPVFLRLCEIPMILYLSSVKYLALLKDEVHYFSDSSSLTVWAISDC
ncbi:hypothetical protein OSB04_019900 [Centaurea solstitialis]|uniref:Uncharacterized protein n=1 Tax=Centaurea solstitialis TaxID=347529 RepID=A0AA38W3C5_9ASTR|nr:hypothetical protein OSB04_019900 [Centaurea solstitialis]